MKIETKFNINEIMWVRGYGKPLIIGCVKTITTDKGLEIRYSCDNGTPEFSESECFPTKAELLESL